MNRNEYRQLKTLSKEEMEAFLAYRDNKMYNIQRKEFEKAYQDELDSSIANFILTIAYTLKFNEDVHLDNDEFASFMEDLYVTVDMFRTGEYKPEDYEAELRNCGVSFDKYDYSKIYRELDEKYKSRIEELENQIKELTNNEDKEC